MNDKIKIVVAAVLAAAGIVGFLYLGGNPMIVRLGALLAGLIAGTAVMWLTAPGKQFYVYAQESIAETKKVVWPTRKETLQTTGAVFLFVVVMALFLWGVDATLLWIVKKFLGQVD